MGSVPSACSSCSAATISAAGARLMWNAQALSRATTAIDAQYRVLVYTAAYTGMRAGELAGLQRRDVDLLRGTVSVRRASKDVNGHLVLGEVKTKQSRRTVSLPAFLKELLKEHLSQPAPGGTGPEAVVFTMKGGAPLRHGAVYRYFRRTVAGYTDRRGKKHPGVLPERLHSLRWHDLRHTCASLSIAAGHVAESGDAGID
jgi:integrase